MQSQYRVMKAPSGQLSAVKIGFNWPIFFTIYIALQILIFVFLNDGNPGGLGGLVAFLVLGVIVGGPIGFIPGALWNKIKHRKLLSRQCAEIGVVTASNSESAIALSRWSCGRCLASFPDGHGLDIQQRRGDPV